MISEDIITHAFYSIRNKPGWVRRCIDLGFSLEEISFMENLDDQCFDVDKKIEKLNEEIYRCGGYEVWSQDTIEGKISVLSSEIARIYKKIEESMQNDSPFIETLVLKRLSGLDQLAKIRSSLRGRQLASYTGNGLDTDIVNAKNFPLEKLLEGKLDRRGYILCPFHADTRPSMLVKGGFGYCFSCNEYCDSIKWLQKVNGKTFREAVSICNTISK